MPSDPQRDLASFLTPISSGLKPAEEWMGLSREARADLDAKLARLDYARAVAVQAAKSYILRSRR